MASPHVLVLRAPGANCDSETQFAFEFAGAIVDRVHINVLRTHLSQLERYQILVIPGGFAHGDDVAAGKILAVQLGNFLDDALRRFHEADKLILGICNGFQALLKAGLIVPPDSQGPRATLARNGSERFEDRWTRLSAQPGRCPFLTGIESMDVPIAHGEGRFLCRDHQTLDELQRNGQVVLRFADAAGRPGGYPVNPNGSQGDVAGLCDLTGRILGLMPHPERHILPTQHPQWTRRRVANEGDGLRLFRNAVAFFA
jgi:phosphoribosylformylglycinamidine synthase